MYPPIAVSPIPLGFVACHLIMITTVIVQAQFGKFSGEQNFTRFQIVSEGKSLAHGTLPPANSINGRKRRVMISGSRALICMEKQDIAPPWHYGKSHPLNRSNGRPCTAQIRLLNAISRWKPRRLDQYMNWRQKREEHDKIAKLFRVRNHLSNVYELL
jgi:hypothetical protein